jgi:hypothetical protein
VQFCSDEIATPLEAAVRESTRDGTRVHAVPQLGARAMLRGSTSPIGALCDGGALGFQVHRAVPIRRLDAGMTKPMAETAVTLRSR